jgi:hypothetical protein
MLAGAASSTPTHTKVGKISQELEGIRIRGKDLLQNIGVHVCVNLCCGDNWKAYV